MKFETKAIHVGEGIESEFGSLTMPIYATSTFIQKGVGEYNGYDYSRAGNPTRTVLEKKLAALEGGKHGFAFASGCAAIATMMHLFKAGDHIVSGDDLYGGSYRLFKQVVENNGITFSFVDTTDLSQIEKAIQKNTKGIFIETPTNPMQRLTDIAAVAKVARDKKLLLMVDNTFASPYFQKPLSLGADVVVHSTTKYLNGHCDVIGGAVITSDTAIAEKIQFLQKSIGAIQGPFESWLVYRGIKTLALRMERHFQNALKIAHYLENHDQVEAVFYPFLKSHPQHELATRQMSGCGGVVTFRLKGDLVKTKAFIEKLKLFFIAESLGGVDSLVEHPAIMTHASLPKAIREQNGITDNLVRLSVGIEAADDLIQDLEQALR